MSRTDHKSASLRRAVMLTTTSSALVPIAGLLTQPLLAQALGVEGRGLLAAAIAPSALALGAATLGLPDALTYLLAKYPGITRRAVLAATAITTVLGVLCLLGAVAALPLLAGGQGDLAEYILIAMIITVPALITGLLRGAAMGRQLWREVALERVAATILRVGALAALFVTDQLTVLNAVVATVALPAVCGLAYWKLALPPGPSEQHAGLPAPMSKMILSYGSRVWFGSIAAALLSRTDQILMVPLSTVDDLGIYTVANVISDVPFLVVTAIAGALAGTNSRSGDRNQVAQATRLTLLLALAGCLALAAVTPVLVAPLFGADFDRAVGPTIVLLGAATVYAPGFIASAGLNAHGRPGLRSVGIGAALAVNVLAFVLVVPTYGAIGACWTNVATAVVFTCFAVVSAGRVLRLPLWSFFLITRQDFGDLKAAIAHFPGAVWRRRSRRT